MLGEEGAVMTTLEDVVKKKAEQSAEQQAAVEQAALKCLYLVTRSLDPTGADRARWTMLWKPAFSS